MIFMGLNASVSPLCKEKNDHFPQWNSSFIQFSEMLLVGKIQ